MAGVVRPLSRASPFVVQARAICERTLEAEAHSPSQVTEVSGMLGGVLGQVELSFTNGCNEGRPLCGLEGKHRAAGIFAVPDQHRGWRCYYLDAVASGSVAAG